MATTANNTSVPVPGSNAGREDATDFISSIATAVGPLLILFGELTTKKFLSLSMGWADDLLLALGPVGIITVAVSAIRISDQRWMKAIIGRARESRGTAEQEFLSSTSSEVCELWSGREIVRLNDNFQSKVVENMVITKTRNNPKRDFAGGATVYRISTAKQALERGLLKVVRKQLQGLPALMASHIFRKVIVPDGPPNLTLNVPGTSVPRWEKNFWCLFGIVIQAFSLGFPAVATYHFAWQRKGAAVPPFAYAIYATGTILNMCGMMLCGRIIERCTKEQAFEPSLGETYHYTILQIQLACTVGSPNFPSCAIRVGDGSTCLQFSSLDKNSSSSIASFASLTAIFGFVLQFVGLSTLHWSATVGVLVASLIMACVRAWLRRGLAKDPVWMAIPEGRELPWIIHRTFNNDWMQCAQFLSGISPIPRQLASLPKTAAVLKDSWGPLTGVQTWSGIGDEDSDGWGGPLFNRSWTVPSYQLSKASISILERRSQQGDALIASQRTRLEKLVGKQIKLGFKSPGFTKTNLDWSAPCVEALIGKDAVEAMPALRQPFYDDLAQKVQSLLGDILEAFETSIAWTSNPPWHSKELQMDLLRGLSLTPLLLRVDSRDALSALVPTLSVVFLLWMDDLESTIASAQPENYAARRFHAHEWAYARVLGTAPTCSAQQLWSCFPGKVFTRYSELNESGSTHQETYRESEPPSRMIPSTGFRKPLTLYGLYNSETLVCQRKNWPDHSVSFEYKPGQPADPFEHDVVYFSRDDNLANQCVQEFINLVLLSICMNLKLVNGRLLDVEPVDTASAVQNVPSVSGTDNTGLLSDAQTKTSVAAGQASSCGSGGGQGKTKDESVLELMARLASMVEDAGFAASFDDAYACVIPAFIKFELLPSVMTQAV